LRLEDVSSYGMGVLLRLQQKVGKHGGEVKLAGEAGGGEDV